MNSSDGTHGTLLFFRKDGQAGTPYPLGCGKTTIGSSKDADIRLKLNNSDLEPIHCIIDVNEEGIATLLNKSILAPVKINSISIRKFKVLNHGNKIELVGKQFQYLNETISEKDVERHQNILNHGILTPAKKRQSVVPLMKSTTKKSPSLRTKTPVQRRMSVRKSFTSSSTDFTVSITPGNKIDRRSIGEKYKTTSKVIASKALGSPKTARKRRLSLGYNLKDSAKSPRVSSRNILLSENIVSSTITEDDEPASTKPSLSMKNLEVQENDAEFLDESNVTVDYQLENSPPRKRMSLRTPSRSSMQITATETTPKIITPINKRLEGSKTPTSLKKVSPSYRPSPKESRSAKRISRRVPDDCIFSPKEAMINTPNNKRVSTRRKEEIPYKEVESGSQGMELFIPINRVSKSTNIGEENFLNSYSPKNIPPRPSVGTRRKLSSVNSDELSSEESVVLNLSSNSPVKNYSRISHVTADSIENFSPRSILRISLRQGQLEGVKTPLNEKEGEKSQRVNVESPIKSKRRSYVKEVMAEPSPKESVGEQPLVKNEEKDNSLDKSKRKSRLSLRKSKITKYDEEQIINQSSSDEFMYVKEVTSPHKSKRSSYFKENVLESSPRDSDDIEQNHSPEKSVRKSRLSLRRSKVPDDGKEDDEIQSSSEESTYLQTDPSLKYDQNTKRSSYFKENNKPDPAKESDIRKSSRRNSIAEKSLKKSEKQSPNRKSRQSLRRNQSTDKEEQSSSEESFHLDLSDAESRRDSILNKNSVEANDQKSDLNSSTKSRQSIRKSSTRHSLVSPPDNSIPGLSRHAESFNVNETDSLNKSRIKTRQSLRRSNIVETEQVAAQDSFKEEYLHLSLSESPGEFLNISARNSDCSRRLSRKSIASDVVSPNRLTKSRKKSLEEGELEMSSSEDSLHLKLSESDSTKQSLNADSTELSSESSEDISRRSLRRRETVESDESSLSSLERSEEKQSIQPEPLKHKRVSSRRSYDSSNRTGESPIASRFRGNNTISEIHMTGGSSDRKSTRGSRDTPTMSNTITNEQDVSVNDSATRTPSQRRFSARKSIRISEVSLANDPVTLSINENDVFQLSSGDESLQSIKTPGNRRTPKLRHSSVRKSHLSTTAQSEDNESAAETPAGMSMRARRSSVHKSTPLNKSTKTSLASSMQNISVITVSDSVDSTPENNTSLIILDTPLEREKKSGHKKLSKTLNSTIQDDVELATPKSAIKSRRSKSLPYNPVTEDITPVSPLGKSKTDSGFKTPLNTPGLFENIRKSVLKSRSRLHRSSSNLMDELNKEEPKVKAVKRARESSSSSVKSRKRRKVMEDQSDRSFVTDSEDLNSSFGSFKTEDILSDISDQNVIPKTPKHFDNLTDKPVINEPRTRSLTEPRKMRPVSLRRSLHAMRLGSQSTSGANTRDSHVIISVTSLSSEQSDSVFEESTDSDVRSRRSLRRSSLAQSDDSKKKVQRSLGNDPSSSRRSSKRSSIAQSDDSAIKVQKSFNDDLSSSKRSSRMSFLAQSDDLSRNDLSDVAGLKKLLKSPREIKSPMNRSVKKLLQTPKTARSPKNDLTNVPNLRKLMSPKPLNSPKNDLRNIVGLKKLFGTPKEVKSPKNDLSAIPNLRKFVSPKVQRSPKNDLTDIVNLKKLMSTPKEVKSPKNDLRKVPNLRRFMSPKKQNSPRNDLSDVAGVKKLLSTPVTQNSPKNDLTNVPNLRRIMSPKQQNSPRNDLTDVRGLKRLMKTPRKTREPINDLSNVEDVASIFNVSGTHRLSNESDIENNEDLFDKLFAKRPLKTYRGRSLSPSTRKSLIYREHRKTLGDDPIMSPRIEKWVEEQAIIKSQKDDDDIDEVLEPVKEANEGRRVIEESNESTRRRRGVRAIEEEAVEENEAKNQEIEEINGSLRRKRVQEETPKEEPKEKVTKRTLRGQKRVEELVDKIESGLESPKRTPKGRRKAAKIGEILEIMESATDEIEAKGKKKPTRGGRKTAKVIELPIDHEETNKSGVEVDSTSTLDDFKQPSMSRGRAKKPSQKQDEQIAEVHSTTDEMRPPTPKRARGRKMVKVEENNDESSTDTEIVSVAPKRGTRRHAIHGVDSPIDALRKRGRDQIESQEEKAPSPRPTRGRRKILDKNDEAIQSPRPVRGRRKLMEKNEVDMRTTPVVLLEEISVEVREKNIATVDEGEPEGTPVGVKRTRSRKEASVESKKPRRGKKHAVGDAEEPKDVQNEALEDIAKVEEPVKRTRGRRIQQPEQLTDTPETIKKGRAKNKTEEKTDKECREVEPTKNTRGTIKGAKNLITEEEKVTSPEVIKKPTRGRKKPPMEVQVEEDSVTEPVKNMRGRRQKQQEPKETDTPKEMEEVPVKPTKKRTRGKALEEETALIDSPRTARAKRGNFQKYGSDFVTESPKPSKPTTKTVHFEQTQTPDENGDSRKRRGRNAAKTEEAEETTRRSKRTRK